MPPPDTTFHDLDICFTIAGNGRGSTSALLTRICDSELEELNHLYKEPDAPDVIAERVARRVFNVVKSLTGKTIRNDEQDARDIALHILNGEMDLKNYQFPDALRETAKEAWDTAMRSLGFDEMTTIKQLFDNRPRITFDFGAPH